MAAFRTKNILLCFDAFGTLFRPRQPIFKQYGEVARLYGVNNFSDEELATSFKDAFKQQSKDHPNYGRATNMGSQRWWTNVIEGTFAPFLSKEQPKLPPAIAPALLHRFNSKEGYEIYQDAFDYIKGLSHPKRQQVLRRDDREHEDYSDRRVVVGIITNSDDRVPDVLSSLGLRVKPLRLDQDVRHYHPTNDIADIDFAIMSYDVGVEKPDPRIFEAAALMLREMLIAEGMEEPDLDDWLPIYVGDDLEKDAFAAAEVGWHGVLVDRDGVHHNESIDHAASMEADMAPFQLVDAKRDVTVIRSFGSLWDITHDH